MSERRDALLASRDLLAGLLNAADDRTAPALSRELRAVMSELDSLPDAGKKATADELKERRAARQTAAKDRAHSKVGE